MNLYLSKRRSHSAVGAPRTHGINELIVCDDAVTIEIHLAGNVARLMVRYEVTLGLHHVTDLVLSHHPVAVEVHLTEGLIRVEVGVSGELLARDLGLPLCTDHSPHQVFKGLPGAVREHIVLSIDIDSLVAAGPSAEHLGVVRLFRCQSCCEFPIVQSSIAVLIVTLHEEVDIVAR